MIFFTTTQLEHLVRRSFAAAMMATAILGLLTSSGFSQSTTRSTSEVDDQPAQNDLAKIYKRSYALVIGASKYQDKAWRELPGVRDDVDSVIPALAAQGFEVTKILDPTGVQLTAAYHTFINKYGQDPDNRLLLYFAGHGYTKKFSYGGEMGYIIPVDAPNPSDDSFNSIALPMEQIEIFAKQINSRHAYFVFDACFAGSIFDTGMRATAASLDWSSAGKPVRQFLTSGNADESVPDKSKFRDQFIEGMGGAADLNGDGYITGTELGEFIVQSFSSSRNPNHPQHGKISSAQLNKGEFIFASPGTARVSNAPAEPAYTMSTSLTSAVGLYTGTSGKADWAAAKQLFIEASSKGDVLATMWIARHYFLGNCNFVQDEDAAQKQARSVIPRVKGLAEKGSADAMFLLGDAYLSGLGLEKDYAQAFAWLQKAAALGNASAMNNLGFMYDNGNGLPKDPVLALSYYRLAGEKGFATALSNIGNDYRDGNGVPKDYAQALVYFNRAAQMGGIYGMFDLAEMYLNGLGVKKDPIVAVKWYAQAAEGGHNYSCVVLARLYRFGDAVPRDLTAAVKYYELGAERGDADAITELSFMYLDGADGLPKDASQVVPLFRKLADKGMVAGLTFLGWAYENGEGVAPDLLRASLYYQQAAEKGDKFSMLRLAAFYYDGKVLPQDFAKAEKYYRQLIDSGLPLAEVGLGKMYEEGKGVPQSYQQAIALYSKVAYPTGTFLNMDVEFGNAGAQVALGHIFEMDSPVQDFAQAMQWYRRAAFQGNSVAMEALARLYENGKGVAKNADLASLWRRNAKVGATRFTVPCDLNGEKTPFYVVILDEYSPDETNPLREVSQWLLADHGAKVPAEVVDSFSRLLAIARDKKVSFTELCLYALNLGREDKKADDKK